MNIATNVPWTRAAEGFPRRAFTVDDIRRMIEAGVIGEDENFELIEGEVVMMSAKHHAHERIKSALAMEISRIIPKALWLGIESSIYLSERTFVEPDLCIYAKDLRLEDVKGPNILLAIEVAASSLTYDKVLKANLYARHRFREFWVIDANERVTWIHTGASDDGWASIVEHGPDETLTTPALPGFAIRLGAID